MRNFISSNVTLVEEDKGEIYLIVKDELSGIIQEYALLKEELARIKEVIEGYQAAK